MCHSYIYEEKMKQNYSDFEKWVARRECINQMMGKGGSTND